MIVTFQDVTEQRNADERIRWAATHDSLTRLPNRVLWQQALDDVTRQGQSMGARFGLMILDIDDLKRINDTLGHEAGDAVLRCVAQRLTAAAPPNAVLGRLGGDEFIIIAPSVVDAQALEACATDLIAALKLPCLYDDRPLECSASVGGSLFGEHGSDAADLLKAADLALHAAKTSGSGRFAIFQPALRVEMQQRESMISMARTAISSDLVLPFYQPKVDLRTGRTVGHEALLRWRHPTQGIQSPASIGAAFENPDLAIALTEQMLTAVTRDLHRWRQAGFDPGPVALNASAADFRQDDFAERVLARLSDHDLPPRLFEIEVTEAVFLGRGAHYAERALRQLSRNGVRIALDDFGTGYASLSHLKHYPVNVLKIDRGFVSNIEHDRHDAAIVDAIVSLGVSMDLEIVAEGVETQNQANSLVSHGCFIGQGYLLGLPRSSADISYGID